MSVVPGISTPQDQANSDWDSGLLVTNPGAGVTLKQTIALKSGIYHIAMWGWASVDARFKLALRNVGDTADIANKNTEIPIPANNFTPPTAPTIFRVAEGELLKVTNVLALTGGAVAQAGIWYARVGG